MKVELYGRVFMYHKKNTEGYYFTDVETGLFAFGATDSIVYGVPTSKNCVEKLKAKVDYFLSTEEGRKSSIFKTV